MSTTRTDLEDRVRAMVAGKNKYTEAFLRDAIDQMAARLDDLSLWPPSIGDIQITLLPPSTDPSDGAGYAGWTVPDPKSGPDISALYKFDDEKYRAAG
jgi:hypothetical protein